MTQPAAPVVARDAQSPVPTDTNHAQECAAVWLALSDVCAVIQRRLAAEQAADHEADAA